METTRIEIQASSKLLKIIAQIRKDFNIGTNSGAIMKALELYVNRLLPLKKEFNDLQISYSDLLAKYNLHKEIICDFNLSLKKFIDIPKSKDPF